MKSLKKILAAILVMAMIATMNVAVFADPTPTTYYLTKELNASVSMGDINETFTFKFTLDTANSSENAPTIADQQITIQRDSTHNVDEETIVATEALILDPDDANTDISFTGDAHGGKFVYTVSEVEPASPTTNMHYSQQTYTLTLYFKNDGSLGAVSLVDTANTSDKLEAGLDKDYTDNNSNGTNDDGDEPGNAFRFVNNMSENVTKDPTGGTDNGKVDDPSEAPFYLSNTVTGDYADLTLQFSYAISVQLPAGASVAPANIKGTKVDADGTETDVAINASANPWTATVTLADGEYFYIDELPVDAVVTTTQTNQTDYTASAVPGITAGKTEYTVKATGNTGVAYTNNCTTTTATGVILNNMPYIVISVMAMVVLFVVVMDRRRREEE